MLPAQTRTAQFIVRLIHDDSGQDLVEYAVLTALIAVGSVLLFSALAGVMGVSYNNWNTASQNAWEPCPPIGSGLACP